MTLDWWSLGLQAINVVILVWLLSRFLFKPVAKIVAERQQAAGRLLDEAAAARDAAEAQRAAAEAERNEQASQRAAGLQALEQEVAAIRARLLEQAEAEVEERRARAEQALAAQQRSAQALAEQRATRLALDVAARLLGRLPDNVCVAPFIDGLVAGIDRLPPAVRQALAAETGPLTLLAPRALAAGELEECRRALARALGRAPELNLAVEPGLIAGLELEGGSAVVRNSFRADLARLNTELSQHDATPV